jgi:chromosome segregation ATPase
VLEEELSTERRNLDEAKRQLALAERPMQGERSTDTGYQSRVKRLRDAVENHERNIAAIQKEISTTR